MTVSLTSALQAHQAYGNAAYGKSASAVQQAANALGSPANAADTARESVSSSAFAEVIGQSFEQAAQVGARASQATRDHIAGDTSIVEVVAAISEAELTIQTMRSVRDRMVAAYQEIARMPI